MPRLSLKGNPIPWVVGGVALIAAPVGHLVNKVLGRHQLKNLPTHILQGPGGLEVHIRPLGAVIQRLIVPDRDGNLEDIVLGFDDMEPYADGRSPYFGAVVGRVANRIADAEFVLEGTTHKLAANNPPNALHGGKRGFDKVVWDGDRIVHPEGDAVRLQYISRSGEEGYPGTLIATVTYIMTREGMLRIIFEATTDKQTPVNMVQHSYFNLAGHAAGHAHDQVLHINGDHYTPLNETQVPTGEIAAVAGTPFDFTEEHPISESISEVPGGYDHSYVLFGMGRQAKFIVKNGAACNSPKLAARLKDPKSGRVLKVLTTAPAMQFYTGNYVEGVQGKAGAVYNQDSGICLETQAFPNAINEKAFPSVVLSPGEKYKHEVCYHFSTE
ncbi:g1409 [Coccomyxa viridis]|uniref:Aldose 1-epimerase n=1 Tax=Coccomyxa viridis TaxID=1274662 RepID=A0ABP1FK26_9CHLO